MRILSPHQINIQDPIHMSDFDIYIPVQIPVKTGRQAIYIWRVLKQYFPLR